MGNLNLTYQLEFFSPWHCGSGLGGGDDADYTPILDAKGFPFVPGKTIKGLFREAAEVLFDHSFVCKIFGQETASGVHMRPGAAIWSNAEIPAEIRAKISPEDAEHLKKGQYFVQLNANGQAVDKSLRRGEYVVPMTLVGTINGIPEDDVDALTQCMGFIKQMGLQRTRGCGKCKFSLFDKVNANAEQVAIKSINSNEIWFKCRLLSSIVLNKTGATQGPMDTLEYIPGSNFMGIVAKNYAEFGADAFTVFHSGKVRFGCAYPLEDSSKRSLPCPATWFIPKGGNLGNGCAIYPTPESRTQEIQKKYQPKQVRGGFFVPSTPMHILRDRIEKHFSLKSAYDSEKRRSQDSMMFGYTALDSGSEWAFALRFDDSITAELKQAIVAKLVGRHQIGRSRSAQYGGIEISILQNAKTQVPTHQTGDDLYLLYASSPIAFTDQWGAPSLLPQLSELGFGENAAFDYGRTQIRYQQYAPWNGARGSRDAERLVILPGSVIAVKSKTPPNAEVLKKGVGLYLSEGFGELLCNPDFLWTQTMTNAPVAKVAPNNETSDGNTLLLKFIEERKKDKKTKEAIYKSVMEFKAIAPQNSVTRSQWGAIRAIVLSSSDFKELLDKLFAVDNNQSVVDYIDIIKNNRKIHNNDPGFLMHGVAARKWQKSGMCEYLKNALETFNRNHGSKAAMVFAERLCAELGKA